MNAKAVLKKERSYREDKTRAFKNVLQYKVKNAIFLVVENQRLIHTAVLVLALAVVRIFPWKLSNSRITVSIK